MAKFRPYEETTVDSVIDAGKQLDLTESTISFKEKIDDEVIIQFHTLISNHYYALTKYIIDLELSDDDYIRYKYKPKLLSYELYGTPELAYSILYINDMPSVTNFNKQKIKVFTDNILDIITELLSLREKDLTSNEASINE